MTLRKALITGGAGFIGTYLTRLLLKEGHHVTVLDRDPSPEFLALSDSNLKFIRGDIFANDELDGLIREADSIFHLSAQPSVQICEMTPEESKRDNFESTLLLLEHLRRLSSDGKKRSFCFTSTSAVYGDVKFSESISEDLPCAPISVYGKDKLRSEQAIFAAVKENSVLSASVFRLFNVYGQGQKEQSPYSGVITKFYQRMKNGEPLIIFGDGSQIRDFVHVKDVAQALYLGSISDGSPTPMNVATGSGTSISELARLFSEMKNVPIVHEDSQKGDIRISIGDPSHLQSTLGWKFSVTLDQGLRSDFPIS